MLRQRGVSTGETMVPVRANPADKLYVRKKTFDAVKRLDDFSIQDLVLPVTGLKMPLAKPEPRRTRQTIIGEACSNSAAH